MSGLYFAHEPPRNYRAWKSSDYSFYDAMAQVLHDERRAVRAGFARAVVRLCGARCFVPDRYAAAFEIAVDATLKSSGAAHKVPA